MQILSREFSASAKSAADFERQVSDIKLVLEILEDAQRATPIDPAELTDG